MQITAIYKQNHGCLFYLQIADLSENFCVLFDLQITDLSENFSALFDLQIADLELASYIHMNSLIFDLS